MKRKQIMANIILSTEPLIAKAVWADASEASLDPVNLGTSKTHRHRDLGGTNESGAVKGSPASRGKMLKGDH